MTTRCTIYLSILDCTIVLKSCTIIVPIHIHVLLSIILLLYFDSHIALADFDLLFFYLPGCWLYSSSDKVSVEAAQCLTYIVFDEVSPNSSNTSVFSLPKTCCIR